VNWLPYVGWCVDCGDDELVDVDAPVVSHNRACVGAWRVVEERVCSDQHGLSASSRWWHRHRGGRALTLCSRHRNYCGGAAAHTMGSPHPGARCSLPVDLLLMARGTRGGSHGMNVQHGAEVETPRRTKSPNPARQML
jgi:hypothetical protein